MDECPFQIVLRGNLIKLSLNQCDVLGDLFDASVDVVGLDRCSSRNCAIDGDPNIEMLFVRVFESSRIGALAGTEAAKNVTMRTPMLEWELEQMFMESRQARPADNNQSVAIIVLAQVSAVGKKPLLKPGRPGFRRQLEDTRSGSKSISSCFPFASGC